MNIKEVFELISCNSYVTIIDASLREIPVVKSVKLTEVSYLDIKDYLDCEVIQISAIEPSHLEITVDCGEEI